LLRTKRKEGPQEAQGKEGKNRAVGSVLLLGTKIKVVHKKKQKTIEKKH